MGREGPRLYRVGVLRILRTDVSTALLSDVRCRRLEGSSDSDLASDQASDTTDLLADDAGGSYPRRAHCRHLVQAGRLRQPLINRTLNICADARTVSITLAAIRATARTVAARTVFGC